MNERSLPRPTMSAAVPRTMPTAFLEEPPRGNGLLAGVWRPGLALVALLLAGAAVAFVVVTDEVRPFRPSWVLHPDETGMLVLGRHLADTGSLVVDDSWYAESDAHVPEGLALAGGRLAPQKAPVGYIVYAGAFLVSDDGWSYVSPFFGLLAACLAGWIVYRKTGHAVAGLAAATALAVSSPFIMYASGLAFVDIIALACFLAGVAAVQQRLAGGGAWSALAAGAALGLAGLTRYDFFAAGGLGLAVLLWANRAGTWRANARASLPYALPLGLAAGGGALANWWLYGGPMRTGYDAGSWKGSPGGVTGSVFDFSTIEFANLASSYLFQIGLSCTLLLLLGVALKWALRDWDGVDALVLGFAAFGMLYFLGKEGAYGTNETWLVGSYPRYLLPAYTAGVIVGIEGVATALRRSRWGSVAAAGVLTAVALVSAAIGLHEAFTNERGVDYTRGVTNVHRVIADVVEQTSEPVVLISDLHSKAAVDARTITPFKAELTPEEVVASAARELDRGRNVLVVGDMRTHPLYTGYMEAFWRSGMELIPRRCSVEVYEVFPKGGAPADAPRSCSEE